MTVKTALFVQMAALATLLGLGLTTAPLGGADTGVPPHAAPAAGQGSGAPSYVGEQTCGRCHQEEQKRWMGSDHQRAMQEANEQTVLGDFDGAKLTYYGLTSTFFKRDGKFMVRTDGPDGTLHDYEIAYTFGVRPLQQYLVEFPGGRLQALSIAWDSRPKEQGGQRWFHLYPKEPITHTDRLHWTGPNQNWNYMCAECHSTHLQKNYDLRADAYRTTWSEISVACEACHGPGSRHVAWAERQAGWEQIDRDPAKGLSVRFNERSGVRWVMDDKTGIARRSKPRESDVEVETCARCHARRGQIWADYVPGRPILDTHLVQLLTPGMYYADGQMSDEVYNYGSFLQSKMFRAGVTCSDCHDPHSLKLRRPGNGVCAQCHRADKYDTPAHHFHKADSAGSSCAACHMPTTTYMVVDPRHDHSIRIPRPDLSVQMGTPNACSKCHADHPAAWAAEQVKRWYKQPNEGYQQFAAALQAGRSGAPGAEQLLTKLAADTGQPDIARATALAALGGYLSPASVGAIREGLGDPDPLLRLGAVEALAGAGVEPRMLLPLLFPMLQDPVRAVRIEALRGLAPVPTDQFPAAVRDVLDKATEEYIAAQQTDADRPEAHMNLGLLYTERGEYDKAEAAYRTALRLQPRFVQAYVNLADLYRLQGKDDEGEKALRQAVAIAPNDPDVQHALGLLLVRQKRLPEAVDALARAARLNPGNARYSYVYAVALNSTGKPEEAIRVLEQANARQPNDREVLFGLVAFQRDRGDLAAARRYAEKLSALSPQDPAVQQLVDQLKGQ